MATLTLGRRLLRSNFHLTKVLQQSNGCISNTLYSQRRSMSFLSAPIGRSKIVLVAGGVFIASAIGTRFYEQRKTNASEADLLKSQLLWDSEQRKFRPSQYSLINQSKKVPLDKIEAIPVSRHVAGMFRLDFS